MTSDALSGFFERDLFGAAEDAARRAPQLATEVRALSHHLAARANAGETMIASDIDVRTLVGLIEQAGVQLPPTRALQH